MEYTVVQRALAHYYFYLSETLESVCRDIDYFDNNQFVPKTYIFNYVSDYSQKLKDELNRLSSVFDFSLAPAISDSFVDAIIHHKSEEGVYDHDKI